ncbi:hypothetical protein [Dyella caseinilytica]|uniref:Uncharacterized protein n=1 Tax=Dyella caseinilytica TaxID=1849581 RepID=A0ABX7GTW8_9GAMM|nr:hypothetical protein [Dyella caseinilytica]QRN53841.1 hypothetical protein ISN74_21020 [Dyella caseinilytica]GFZ89562.1 hypothetical protein GCM10011408_05670 [Dyella caseinilytica]
MKSSNALEIVQGSATAKSDDVIATSRIVDRAMAIAGGSTGKKNQQPGFSLAFTLGFALGA